jgi:Globin
LGRDGVHSTDKKFTIVRLDCENQIHAPPPLWSCDGRRICSRTYFDWRYCRASWRRLADSFMAAYSHFAWRCRVIPDTSAARSALRACVVRAANGCALSWWHRHRKPPPGSIGGYFETAPAVKPLFRGDMTEQGCKLMATLDVVVNSLGNLEAVLPAASALAKRHVDRGVKAAITRPLELRCCGRWSRVLGLG